MTIEITAPPAPGSDAARRISYMAALAAAEHVLSTTPVIPTDFTIACTSWADSPSLRFQFHRSPANVRAFAEAFGGAVREEQWDDGKQVHTIAVGCIGDIPFEAWALVNVGGAE